MPCPGIIGHGICLFYQIVVSKHYYEKISAYLEELNLLITDHRPLFQNFYPRMGAMSMGRPFFRRDSSAARAARWLSMDVSRVVMVLSAGLPSM